MNTPSWQSVIIAALFLALVAFIIVFCGTQADTFDEYSQYWGLFSMIAGVTTGAIPSFFFHSEAKEAKKRATDAQDEIKRGKEREMFLAGKLHPDTFDAIKAAHPSLFN